MTSDPTICNICNGTGFSYIGDPCRRCMPELHGGVFEASRPQKQDQAIYQAGRVRGHREEQAEALRLRDALTSIATLRQEADDWEHPDFDWRHLARKMEAVARIAVHLVESKGPA